MSAGPVVVGVVDHPLGIGTTPRLGARAIRCAASPPSPPFAEELGLRVFDPTNRGLALLSAYGR